MSSDAQILQAVEGLRDEWPDLLGGDAQVLAGWLAAAPRDDAEAMRQTANRVLDLLQKHPQAMARVSSALGVKGELALTLRGYEPIPGSGVEVAAGTLMACPIDPSHYRRRLRQKGQPLFCPEHGVALAPVAPPPAKE